MANNSGGRLWAANRPNYVSGGGLGSMKRLIKWVVVVACSYNVVTAGLLVVVNTTGGPVLVGGETLGQGRSEIETTSGFGSHPMYGGMAGLTGSEDWAGGEFVYYITAGAGSSLVPRAGVNYLGAAMAGMGLGFTMFGFGWILRLTKKIPSGYDC